MPSILAGGGSPRSDLGYRVVGSSAPSIVNNGQVIGQQVGNNNKQDLTVKADNLVVGKPDRHLNDLLRKQLQEQLPKDRKVTVVAVMGDGEALRFAEEVKSFLQRQRYDVSGVDQALYSGPVVGLGIVPSGDGFEVLIGSNPDR
jgi:hypothetical protein